jgi:hypothetical protein
MTWIHLALDRDQRRDLAKMVMNTRVPLLLGNSRVAERLTAFQERLSTVKLINILYKTAVTFQFVTRQEVGNRKIVEENHAGVWTFHSLYPLKVYRMSIYGFLKYIHNFRECTLRSLALYRRYISTLQISSVPSANCTHTRVKYRVFHKE